MRSVLTIAAILSVFSPAILLAQEKKAEQKITYDDHIRPILRESCFTCHNQNDAKSGLALDTYAKLMTGGSSGEVVLAGDVESSRLYALVAHLEEPKMPPMADKLAEPKLDLIKKWIEGGALENAGSTATVKKKKMVELATGGGAGKPEGPAAMPEGVWKQPLVVTSRKSAVTAIAASPWAPLLAVAGQRQISLYHTESGKLLGVLPFLEGMPHVLRFSRNGALLLAAGGRGGQTGIAAVYDVKTGKRLAAVGEELDAVLAADISADHSMIALGGPGKIVRIYSVETGEKLHEIKKHTDWIYAIEFSPDGVLLATGDRSGGLFVWEADTAREYLSLRGHTGAIFDVSWRSDSNLLASASEDTTVKLWEMNDGNQVKNWGAHGGGALSVQYSMDGKIATAGRDKTAKLWNGDGGGIRTFPASTEDMLHVVVASDNNRVIAGDWAGNIRMWNAADGAQMMELLAYPETYEQRIARMAQDADATKATVVAAATEMTAADAIVAEKAKLLDAAAKAQEAATAEMAQVAAAKDAAEKSLAQLTPLMQSTAQALAAVEASSKALPEDKTLAEVLAAAKATHDRVAKGKADLDAQLPQFVEKQKACEAKIAAAKAELDKSAIEKADMEAQAVAKKAAHDAVKQALDAKVADLTATQAEFVAFQSRPAQLRESAAKLKAEAAAAAESIKAAEAEAAKSVVERDAKLAEEKALGEKVAALQAELAKLIEAKNAAIAAADVKQKAVDAAKEAAAKAEESAAAAEKEAAELEKAFGKGAT
jgi:WD40 repeat protein